MHDAANATALPEDAQMTDMPRFNHQKRYADIKSEEATRETVRRFTADFLDWYHDRLVDAPTLSGDTWMTAQSSLGHGEIRNRIQRGVGGYLRKRDRFPDFQHARDFTAITRMTSRSTGWSQGLTF